MHDPLLNYRNNPYDCATNALTLAHTHAKHTANVGRHDMYNRDVLTHHKRACSASYNASKFVSTACEHDPFTFTSYTRYAATSLNAAQDVCTSNSNAHQQERKHDIDMGDSHASHERDACDDSGYTKRYTEWCWKAPFIKAPDADSDSYESILSSAITPAMGMHDWRIDSRIVESLPVTQSLRLQSRREWWADTSDMTREWWADTSDTTRTCSNDPNYNLHSHGRTQLELVLRQHAAFSAPSTWSKF